MPVNNIDDLKDVKYTSEEFGASHAEFMRASVRNVFGTNALVISRISTTLTPFVDCSNCSIQGARAHRFCLSIEEVIRLNRKIQCSRQITDFHSLLLVSVIDRDIGCIRKLPNRQTSRTIHSLGQWNRILIVFNSVAVYLELCRIFDYNIRNLLTYITCQHLWSCRMQIHQCKCD